jgi:GH15 family glucan-1,4-alpha-glucosidase
LNKNTNVPLNGYACLGDGRSVAMVSVAGSIDWLCVPDVDSLPVFDRLLDVDDGACFSVAPDESFELESRLYLERSNVLVTVFRTTAGRVRLTESLNSGAAGRLPWTELARRVECLSGSVMLTVQLRFSHRTHTVSPYLQQTGAHLVFHVGDTSGVFLHCEHLCMTRTDDRCIEAKLALEAGQRAILGIVAGESEPLLIPSLQEIDSRIDGSHKAWREWTNLLQVPAEFQPELYRSALSLKLLLHSPTAAIVAAATTSLPEKIGGKKNYDYRFAWIRDAGYTIKAFLRIGAKMEAHAAYRWLLERLDEHGACVCYTLSGKRVPEEQEIEMAGYQHSTPVVYGNNATVQHQHGIYGDILGTTYVFVQCGGVLDHKSAALLSTLVDECADRWLQRDSGMWELEELQHYTMSKISCWEALARAVELADQGYLPTTCRDRWSRERDRIAAWIEQHCWSENKQAYTLYAGTDKLDASLALAIRFRFDGTDRLQSTLIAIQKELGDGAFHYRYTGMRGQEGRFLACTFWMADAYACLGNKVQARTILEKALAALGGAATVLPEMIGADGEYLGNMPQGLSHLALIQAICELQNSSN